MRSNPSIAFTLKLQYRDPNGEMEDESHGRPKSPRLKSGSSNNNNNSNGWNSSKEQDPILPVANVGRIMKKAIPKNGKISKDAKEIVQECVSEIIFVIGEASNKYQRDKRKMINGDGLIWALTALGFKDYTDPFKLYLNRYREIE